MAEGLRRPRCECCDEVLEELLSMRQGFEKFFHRFNSKIVELRRELRAIVDEKLEGKAITDIASRVAGVKRRAKTRSPSPERKTTRRERSTVDLEASLGSDDDAISIQTRQQPKLSQESNVKTLKKVSAPLTVKLESSSRSSISANSIRSAKRPVLDFFGIQLRVMPTCPFKNEDEFEEWESLLRNDEDQRDHLRVELLQGHFDDAEKYVKHIWSSLLSDDAAEGYSYRGNLKTEKKAIKSYTFTLIFKECFLQRYEHHDAFVFMERTMRFFNYAHDRLRRISKAQNKFEKVQLRAEHDADDADEQTIDESLEHVLNEGELDCVYVEGI